MTEPGGTFEHVVPKITPVSYEIFSQLVGEGEHAVITRFHTVLGQINIAFSREGALEYASRVRKEAKGGAEPSPGPQLIIPTLDVGSLRLNGDN